MISPTISIRPKLSFISFLQYIERRCPPYSCDRSNRKPQPNVYAQLGGSEKHLGSLRFLPSADSPTMTPSILGNSVPAGRDTSASTMLRLARSRCLRPSGCLEPVSWQCSGCPRYGADSSIKARGVPLSAQEPCGLVRFCASYMVSVSNS